MLTILFIVNELYAYYLEEKFTSITDCQRVMPNTLILTHRYRSIYWLIKWLLDWFTQGLRNATTPHDNWGPALEENRKGRYVVGQENKGFEAEEKETKLGDDMEIKKNGNSNGSSISVQF